MKFPEKAANYPGGEQAFTQSNREDELAWSGQFGGPKGPRQNAILQQGGQNPYEWEQGGGGQNPLTALGLAGYQGGQGGQGGVPASTAMPPQGPPRQDIFGIRGMGEQIGGFGETLGGYGEQLGGLGEQIGGYKEQMGGFGEQLGGFGEQLGGFKGQFENIDSRLQNMEQGISGLTDKLGVQQQQQNPFQGISSFGFGGSNPFYGGYSYFTGGGPVKKPSLFQKLFDYGKNVASMQLGGGVTGAGTGKSDSIPAMLSDGEFIMTAKSVKGMGGGNREKGFKKLNTMMKSAEGRAV